MGAWEVFLRIQNYNWHFKQIVLYQCPQNHFIKLYRRKKRLQLLLSMGYALLCHFNAHMQVFLLNPITVGGGLQDPSVRKRPIVKNWSKQKSWIFGWLLISRSCGHFKTIPSVLSGLCENWWPIEVRSPEIFLTKIFEFFFKTQFFLPLLTIKLVFGINKIKATDVTVILSLFAAL